MTNKPTDQKSSSTYLPLLLKTTRAAISGQSLGALRMKLNIFSRGLRHKADLQKIAASPRDGALLHLLNTRPEALGLLIWPYQSADWNTETRLARFQAHYDVIDTLPASLNFGPEQKIVLADLREVYPELKLILDQPKWMMREGGLTINLFVGAFRAFSLTFSFFRNASGTLEVLIGGCQGRDTEDILDTYRALTKAAYGLRPRDLLMECFGMFCRTLGVEEMRAVSDANRHRRHPFFKQSGNFKQSYDAVWTERGGVLSHDGFYDLPLASIRKDPAEIKANKRSMYRKRFEFLDDLETRIPQNLQAAEPVSFQET